MVNEVSCTWVIFWIKEYRCRIQAKAEKQYIYYYIFPLYIKKYQLYFGNFNFLPVRMCPFSVVRFQTSWPRRTQVYTLLHTSLNFLMFRFRPDSCRCTDSVNNSNSGTAFSVFFLLTLIHTFSKLPPFII